MRVVKSIAIWITGMLLTVIFFFIQLCTTCILYPFDKKRKVAHVLASWWAKSIITVSPFWKLTVDGLENINPRQSYIIIANHQSLADIIVMYNIRTQFRWVAKESMFKVPFIGNMLSFGRHVKLLRGNFGSIKKAHQQAAWWLRNNISVVYFPEGTRSDTARMNKFKNGAFKLAIQEKKPILPVAIKGTRGVIQKGSSLFNAKAVVDVHILPSINTAEYASSDFAFLRDAVWTKLAHALQ